MAKYKKFRFVVTAGLGFERSYIADVDIKDYSEYDDWDDVPGDEMPMIIFHIEEECSDWALEHIESYIEEV